MISFDLGKYLNEAERVLSYATPDPMQSASLLFEIRCYLFSAKKTLSANYLDSFNRCYQKCNQLVVAAELEIEERCRYISLQLESPKSLVYEEVVHIVDTYLRVDTAISFYLGNNRKFNMSVFISVYDDYMELHRRGKFNGAYKALKKNWGSDFFKYWLITIEKPRIWSDR